MEQRVERFSRVRGIEFTMRLGLLGSSEVPPIKSPTRLPKQELNKHRHANVNQESPEGLNPTHTTIGKWENCSSPPTGSQVQNGQL